MQNPWLMSQHRKNLELFTEIKKDSRAAKKMIELTNYLTE